MARMKSTHRGRSLALPCTMPATTLLGSCRLVLALAIIVAIAATLLDTLTRGPVNVFNFFGYFTIQSNLLLAGALIAAAAYDLRGRAKPRSLELYMAYTTTYIVIVGLVYALLLAPLGAAGGVPVPWANFVLHYLTPVAAAVVWLLVGDRRGLRWNRLLGVLVYPAIWLTVVLIRGATDGWVPYPFLDPANGYGSVAVTCVFICVAILGVGALVFWASRLRLLAVGVTED